MSLKYFVLLFIIIFKRTLLSATSTTINYTTTSDSVTTKNQITAGEIAIYVVVSIIGGAILWCCYGQIRQKYLQRKTKIETDLASVKPASDEKQYRSDNYKEWNSQQIIEWIITLDPSIYKQYKQTLIIVFDEEKIDGQDLKDIDMSDIKRWGIKEFKHSKTLMKQIKQLVGSDNSLDNSTPIVKQSNINVIEGVSVKRTSTLMQIEGDRKTTKVESAVHLEIKQGDNYVDDDDNSKEEKKENVLDAMLSDVMKMPSLDPNKIEQLSKVNETDSEQSENMYEKSNEEKQSELNDIPGAVVHIDNMDDRLEEITNLDKSEKMDEMKESSDDSADMYVT